LTRTDLKAWETIDQESVESVDEGSVDQVDVESVDKESVDAVDQAGVNGVELRAILWMISRWPKSCVRKTIYFQIHIKVARVPAKPARGCA
jgi:hypothetical protein